MRYPSFRGLRAANRRLEAFFLSSTRPMSLKPVSYRLQFTSHRSMRLSRPATKSLKMITRALPIDHLAEHTTLQKHVARAGIFVFCNQVTKVFWILLCHDSKRMLCNTLIDLNDFELI